MPGFPSHQFPGGRSPEPAAKSYCPLCGLPNKCGVEEGKGFCWCMSYPAVEHLTVKDTETCICESCLKKEMKKS
jgi:hypothetical protein